MNSLTRAILITAAAVAGAVGYVALLSIDGMSDWYYMGMLCLLPIIAFFAIVYAMEKRKEHD